MVLRDEKKGGEGDRSGQKLALLPAQELVVEVDGFEQVVSCFLK